MNKNIGLLKDILSAIEEIESCQRDDAPSRTKKYAMAYMVAVIGEASNNLSKEFIAEHDTIPWSDIIGMRHRIIHGYNNLDYEFLSQVVKKDIPLLKTQVEALLRDILK